MKHRKVLKIKENIYPDKESGLLLSFNLLKKYFIIYSEKKPYKR